MKTIEIEITGKRGDDYYLIQNALEKSIPKDKIINKDERTELIEHWTRRIELTIWNFFCQDEDIIRISVDNWFQPNQIYIKYYPSYHS